MSRWSEFKNQEGMMLKRLQEECRDTIKVVVQHCLLDSDLASMPREREAKCRQSEEMRKNAPRGTMPWSEYKQLLKARLTEASGWVEIGMMARTRRKEGTLANAWLQTITRGKEIILEYGHDLADRAHVKKVTKDLMPSEREKIDEAHYALTKAHDASYTLEKAAGDIDKLDWDTFYSLMKNTLINSTRKYLLRLKPNTNQEERLVVKALRMQAVPEGRQVQHAARRSSD